MQKSSYIYRGYITYSGRPSLEPNQTDNVMGRTTPEFSHVPSFTREKNSSPNPVKDDRKGHHETSTVYGGPAEELISKITDDVNRRSTISPSIGAVTVAGQPHDSGGPTEVCDGDYCYYTNQGRQQPDANFVRNEKIDDSGTEIDQSNTPSTGTWARPTSPPWAAKLVSLSTSPSTGLYGATNRGEFLIQKEQGKRVAHVTPQHDSYNVNLRNDSGKKPTQDILGGYPKPSHVMGATLPSNKAQLAQLGESQNYRGGSLEPPKEYGKPASVPAALTMDHNNASAHNGMQSNDMRKATLPLGDGTHGMSQSANNNGKLKEAPKPTPIAIASAHPTGLNSTAGRNGLEEQKPVGNNSWGDSSAEWLNRRHGLLPPTSITNNGEWPRPNPPRAVSLSATGPQIGEPVNGSKAVEPLNEAAKATLRHVAPPEPKYNPVSSAVKKKESLEKPTDSGEAPRRYGNLDPSSQLHLQTAGKNKGSIDHREAARKYRGMQLGNT